MAVTFQNEDATCKSSEGSEDTFNDNYDYNISTFTVKVVQPKSQLNDLSGHEVTFTLKFLISFPGVFSNIHHSESISTRASNADPLGRNIQQLYHLEFRIFPPHLQKEPFKTDIGFYGTYVKIYPEKSESRVLSAWNDGEDTWVVFSERFKYWITDEHVRALTNHQLIVKIWDTKDKCAPKVRFDRPKPPKSSSRSQKSSKSDFCNFIKTSVCNISKEYQNSAAYKEDTDRLLPHQTISLNTPIQTPKNRRKTIPISSANSSKSTRSKVPDKQMALYASSRDSLNSQMESFGQIEKLIQPNKAPETISTLNRSKTFIIEPKKESEVTSQTDINPASESEEYNLNGRCSIDIPVRHLFIKSSTISRISTSNKSIEDLFCQLSIQSNILSEIQVQKLNPLTIKIKSIENLPGSPNYQNLIEKFKRVYLEYNFCDKPTYTTCSKLHNKDIHYDDVSVILLGDLDQYSLKDQLVNSFLTIKLFDQIPRIKIKPNFDNNSSSDVKNIGDINITSNTSTVNVTEYPTRHFGEAKVDLSDLIVRKLKYLELIVPIVPVSIIATNDESTITKTNDECAIIGNRYVNYLESGTTIKLSIQLADPITFSNDSTNSSRHFEFINQLILINKNLNCDIIRSRFMKLVIDYNCNKLEFENGSSDENKRSFLFSLSKDKSKSDQMNMTLNGYFMIDNELELVVIQNSAELLKEFYNECMVELLNDYNEYVVNKELLLLYDESCDCKISAGDNFPVLSMIPVTLSKRLSFFIAQPLLYVRDIIPKECVQGLCKLYYLTQTETMMSVLRNDLVPTNRMFQSMIEYLCTELPPTNDNIGATTTDEPKSSRKLIRKSVKTAPILTRTKQSIQKQPRFKSSVDTRRQKYVEAKSPKFSYSSQTKNSVESILNEIRQRLDPNRRYTYSKDFLFSGNFEMVDLDKLYVEEEHSKNSEGRWNVLGPRTAMDDYNSGLTLDEYRREELRTERWRENELHRSYMEPTLPERDEKFGNFKVSMDKSPNYSVGISMRQSYVEEEKAKLEKEKQERKEWLSKICVESDNIDRMRFYRRSLKTEQIERGPGSSNQIDRFSIGLRKVHRPTKKAIVINRHDPNKIPGLSIYSNKGDESENIAFTIGPYSSNLMTNHLPLFPQTNQSGVDFNRIHVTGSRDQPPYTLYHKSKIPQILLDRTSSNHICLANSPFVAS